MVGCGVFCLYCFVLFKQTDFLYLFILGTEQLLEVLGLAMLLIKPVLGHFRTFVSLTPTPISPMLHTFCPTGHQDIGQSQQRQSCKYNITKIAFVFLKVCPSYELEDTST